MGTPTTVNASILTSLPVKDSTTYMYHVLKSCTFAITTVRVIHIQSTRSSTLSDALWVVN